MKEQIMRLMKSYSYKPYYVLKLQAEACYYNILLNDIPVVSFGTKGGISNEIPLNNYILKSGRQILKIELLPFLNKVALSSETSCTADVGFSPITSGKNMGPYSQSATFNLPRNVKEKKLPAFSVELPFQAKVPWDYQYMLDNAQNMGDNPATDRLLDNAVKKLLATLSTKDVKKYQAIITDSVAKESDVFFRTSDEIDFIIRHSDLTDITKVNPLPKYHKKLFCKGRIVQALSEVQDEHGNRSVINYGIHPLAAGGREGFATEDYLYYLPKGKTELEVL